MVFQLGTYDQASADDTFRSGTYDQASADDTFRGGTYRCRNG